MTNESTPSLADDEKALRGYAVALADAVDRVVAPWLLRLVALRSPSLASNEEVGAALNSAAATTTRELRELLLKDIADQTIGPLEVLRRAVAVPTSILTEAQVAPVERDDFSRTNFPDDVYDLTPASFAAVDPALHEPGLIWGAAKAHVHLRRRRERTPTPVSRHVVVLSADLMDRSKISAALPEATLVRSPTELSAAATDAELVIVDLGRLDSLDTLGAIDSRVIAFGSHVNDEQLAAAEAAGAEALPRSVFFRRLAAGEI